jgi:hypothetical protein
MVLYGGEGGVNFRSGTHQPCIEVDSVKILQYVQNIGQLLAEKIIREEKSIIPIKNSGSNEEFVGAELGRIGYYSTYTTRNVSIDIDRH